MTKALIKKYSYIILFVLITIFIATPLFAASTNISWTAPTTNEDNSPLTDLSGYKIYYGTSSGNYSQTINVGNQTTYQVTGLTAGLTYYFAVTAYDTSNNESSYSTEINKYIAPSTAPEIIVTDSVSPAGDLQIPYGNVTDGSYSDHTVTVTNIGDANLSIGTVAQNDTLAAPFSFINNYCSGQTLTPSSNCTMTVRFSPTGTGVFGDTFDIPSNDSDESSITIIVSGQGDAAPAPDITVTDSVSPSTDHQISFGSLTEGTSSNQTVTITNDGNADLIIGTIAQSNSISAPFSIINNYCSGQTVSASSSCTLTVRFSPSVSGSFNDSFDIPSNDSDEDSITINVSGQATAAPVPDITVTDSVSPTTDLQVTFGDVTSGNSSSQTVTITNDGNANLLIGTIAQSNPLASPFSITNNSCSGQTIASSSSCTLTVRFSPAATGSFNDSFDIPSNDSDESSVTVNVNGTGTPPPVPDIAVTDTVGSSNDLQIPFGDVTEGSGSTKTITIVNNGNTALILGTIAQINTLASPFSITNDNCSGQNISESNSCTLSVSFQPDTTGTYNDSFDIPSNDPDENPVTFTVNGTGLPSSSNNSPDIPQLVYPANSQEALGTSIEFKWEKASDPDGDSVTYNFYVCTDQSFTTGCTTNMNIAYLDDQIYFAGIAGFSSLIMIFGIAAFFIGRSESNKKSNLLIAIIVTAGLLLTACGGGGGGGGGAGVVGNIPDSGQNQVTNTVSGLDTGTTYYWKVVADDGNGGQTESPVYSFDTE